MTDMADLVVDARLRAGLSQRELARRAGTSQSAIARIEGRAVRPSLATVRRLAAACGFELRLSLVPAGTPDAVVAAYKRDVDRTLLRENLRKTVGQRLSDMEAFRKSAERLRGAVVASRRRARGRGARSGRSS